LREKDRKDVLPFLPREVTHKRREKGGGRIFLSTRAALGAERSGKSSREIGGGAGRKILWGGKVASNPHDKSVEEEGRKKKSPYSMNVSFQDKSKKRPSTGGGTSSTHREKRKKKGGGRKISTICSRNGPT